MGKGPKKGRQNENNMETEELIKALGKEKTTSLFYGNLQNGIQPTAEVKYNLFEVLYEISFR